MPLRKSQEPPNAPAPENQAAAEFDENRVTNKLLARDRRPRPVAVVVDDSVDAQELFRHFLEDAGYLVHEAHNGKQALEMLVDMRTPTVIVLDLLMPVMNGAELLDILYSYTRLARVPIIVVTASDQELEMESPLVCRLNKPVDGAKLVAKVDELLKLKSDGG